MIIRIGSIILLVLIFGCSKDENPSEDFNTPEDYISFYLDDIFIEEVMNRTGRIGYLQYNLFDERYQFFSDTITYNGDQQVITFFFKVYVYNHPDSINIISKKSNMSMFFERTVDSSISYTFSTLDCIQNSFKLLITYVERIDSLNGKYDATFEGYACDPSGSQTIEIKNGKILNARL